jgi:hypothetical protein
LPDGTVISRKIVQRKAHEVAASEGWRWTVKEAKA